MGFQRNIKRINMGPATGKEKRGRARRKPQMPVQKTPRAGSKTESSTRVGASRELPITLDSDDDSPAGNPSRPGRHQSDTSLMNPLGNSHTPTGFVLRRSSPALTSRTTHQKTAISKGTTKTQSSISTFMYPVASSDAFQSPLRHENAGAIRKPTMTTMADARTLRLPTPITPDTPTTRGTQSGTKCPRESKTRDTYMSLMDIDDFSTRSKVAQLMAVAPALAVIDLYHLIIDSQGDLPRARKQAIRISEAPAVRYRPGVDKDGDEIMVKIDLNDPAFEWDDDESCPGFNITTAARTSKSSLKSIKSRDLQTSARVAKSTKSNKKTRSNVGAKRTKPAFTNPTHARETSSDRDFIVPDKAVDYNLNSDVYNDSDHSTSTDVHDRCVNSDTGILDGDDQLDLDIDMQPRFAYNAELLGHARKDGDV